MPDLPAAEVEKLQKKHGYGFMRVVDGAAAGYSALWAAPWPPPARMLMLIPALHPNKMVELPEEPEQLAAMRIGVQHGWQIFEMNRGDHSQINDADAVTMTHVVRMAEYHQGEVFEP